jgi:hypothetical protein
MNHEIINEGDIAITLEKFKGLEKLENRILLRWYPSITKRKVLCAYDN